LNISFIKPEGFTTSMPAGYRRLNPSGSKRDIVLFGPEWAGVQPDANTLLKVYSTISLTVRRYNDGVVEDTSSGNVSVRVSGGSSEKKPEDPNEKLGTNGAPSKNNLERLMEVANKMLGNSGTYIGKTARIKVAGEDAIALYLVTPVPEVNEDGGIRIIVTVHSGRMYVFQFGTLNREFPDKVKVFEKMIASIKFLDVKPTPKPTGKKK
jgi:hypothetical protein